MRLFAKIFMVVITVLTLSTSGYAQTPQEQLSQFFTELQKAPTNTLLREKIIKLAASMKPAPTLPDIALTHEGRAQFAFKNAKSEGDYVAAAQEYEKAVAAAPWVAGYYSDLCTIYEKAGNYLDAKRNCGFYLVSLSDTDEINNTKKRIAGLDFGIEQSAKAKAASETPEAKDAAFMKSVEGARFVVHEDGKSFQGVVLNYDDVYEIKSGKLVMTMKVYAFDAPGMTLRNGISRPGNYEIFSVERRNGAYTYEFVTGESFSYTISKDGQGLIRTQLKYPRNFPASIPLGPPITIKRQ